MLIASTTMVGQKTYEFQKIQLGDSDQRISTKIVLDRCMNTENDYCVATIELEGNPKMEFTIESTIIEYDGKLRLEMTSNYDGTKVAFEVNPEENVALFLQKTTGVFAFFKKEEVNVIFRLKY